MLIVCACSLLCESFVGDLYENSQLKESRIRNQVYMYATIHDWVLYQNLASSVFGECAIWTQLADFNLASQAWLLTALTLRPPENFNLAVNGQIRQIANTVIIPSSPPPTDIYVSVVSFAHCVASKGYYIAMVSTNVETANPEEELKPGLSILGPVKEKWVWHLLFQYLLTFFVCTCSVFVVAYCGHPSLGRSTMTVIKR